MQKDREPMSGTNMALVLDLLRQGQSRWEVKAATGFSREKVAYTICNLRRLGYYQQSPEDRYNEWREAISRGRGGIYISIQEYANLGMSPQEIREAVILRKQKEVSLEQIRNAVSKARIRGHLRHLTDEEKNSIRTDSHRTTEKIRQRVCLWLEVKDLIDTGSLSLPADRIEWLLLSRFLGERRVHFHQGQQLDGIFPKATDISFNDISPLLSPHLAMLRSVSTQPGSLSNDVIVRNLALPGEFKPGEVR